VFTCSSREVADFRRKQQEILWKQFDLIDTPDEIVHAIQMGILSLESSSVTQPPSTSCKPAFDDQTALGWEAMLRGRISLLWQSSFTGGNISDKTSKRWAGNLVLSLIQYAQQLWVFRCGVVHGHDKDDAKQRLRSELLHQIREAYEEYSQDPF